MAKDLDLENLETTAETAVETTASDKAQARKEKAIEAQPLVEAGLDRIEEIGVSEKFAAVMAAARVWNVGDKDEVSAAKEAMFEALGGQEAGKEYLTGEFVEEIEGLRGLQPAISVLNTIYHFYKPRESKGGSGSSKAKVYVLVRIDNVQYQVLDTVHKEGAEMENEDKKVFYKEHPTTIEVKEIETL